MLPSLPHLELSSSAQHTQLTTRFVTNAAVLANTNKAFIRRHRCLSSSKHPPCTARNGRAPAPLPGHHLGIYPTLLLNMIFRLVDSWGCWQPATHRINGASAEGDSLGEEADPACTRTPDTGGLGGPLRLDRTLPCQFREQTGLASSAKNSVDGFGQTC